MKLQGPPTVYALIKAGEMRAVHMSRSCRIARCELVRYVTGFDAGLGDGPSQLPVPHESAERTRRLGAESNLAGRGMSSAHLTRVGPR